MGHDVESSEDGQRRRTRDKKQEIVQNILFSTGGLQPGDSEDNGTFQPTECDQCCSLSTGLVQQWNLVELLCDLPELLSDSETDDDFVTSVYKIRWMEINFKNLDAAVVSSEIM